MARTSLRVELEIADCSRINDKLDSRDGPSVSEFADRPSHITAALWLALR